MKAFRPCSVRQRQSWTTVHAPQILGPQILESLTPNRILLLRSMPTLPPGAFLRSDLYARCRWKKVQYLTDLFWCRWTKESPFTAREAEVDISKEKPECWRHCPGGWPHCSLRVLAIAESAGGQTRWERPGPFCESPDKDISPWEAHH